MSQSGSRKVRLGAPLSIDKPEFKKKPPQEPFEFSLERDGTISLQGAIYQALGAASTCWTGGTNGVFMSDRVLEIGRKLEERLQEEL